MARNKTLTFEDIDLASKSLPVDEQINLWRNLKEHIETQMSDIQKDVDSKKTLCSEWDSLKNGKA